MSWIFPGEKDLALDVHHATAAHVGFGRDAGGLAEGVVPDVEDGQAVDLAHLGSLKVDQEPAPVEHLLHLVGHESRAVLLLFQSSLYVGGGNRGGCPCVPGFPLPRPGVGLVEDLGQLVEAQGELLLAFGQARPVLDHPGNGPAVERPQPLAPADADRERGIGVPVSGGAVAPLVIAVGPTGLVAVEDRGTTRLYDSESIFLGKRDGVVIGFGPDAELAVTGGAGPLTVYNRAGNALWYADPWSEAFACFGLGDSAAAGLVRASASPFTSPAGEVYWPMRIEVGQIASIPSPDEPDTALPQWETVEAFDAFLLYDATGNLLRCVRETMPQKLVFTPSGTVFGSGVATQGGMILREFTGERGTFDYLRSVRVPAGAAYGEGPDASLLVLEPLVESGPLRFTVYATGGGSAAVRFSLPVGHGFVAADAAGRLYSSLLTAGGLEVSCWRWPTP